MSNGYVLIPVSYKNITNHKLVYFTVYKHLLQKQHEI